MALTLRVRTKLVNSFGVAGYPRPNETRPANGQEDGSPFFNEPRRRWCGFSFRKQEMNEPLVAGRPVEARGDCQG